MDRTPAVLHWTSKHKQSLIVLYLVILELLPKRQAYEFIITRRVSTRLTAVLETIQETNFYTKLAEAINGGEANISRNCDYYYCKRRFRYRSLVPRLVTPLLIQMLNDILSVKAFYKTMNEVSQNIFKFSTRSTQLRFLNRMIHRYLRFTAKFPLSAAFKPKMRTITSKYFASLKRRIRANTLTDEHVGRLYIINQNQVSRNLFGRSLSI